MIIINKQIIYSPIYISYSPLPSFDIGSSNIVFKSDHLIQYLNLINSNVTSLLSVGPISYGGPTATSIPEPAIIFGLIISGLVMEIIKNNLK